MDICFWFFDIPRKVVLNICVQVFEYAFISLGKIPRNEVEEFASMVGVCFILFSGLAVFWNCFKHIVKLKRFLQ